MLKARLALVLLGLLLPYLARLPGGSDWLAQYADAGVAGALFLSALNAIAWGSLLAISFLYRKPLSLLVAALPAFLFLTWAHYSLDLSADAQSALGIVVLPVYALLPVLVGGISGYLLDKRLRPAN